MAASLDVIIEIPKGSRSKYEFDAKAGRLRLDRVLHSSVHYPADYGFIPGTLALDGDHLDALILAEEPSFPGSIQEVRPIAVLDMRDEKGQDEKILCVPLGDPRLRHMERLEDVPQHLLREISVFFETYKALEDGKELRVEGWQSAAAAWDVIEQARRRYADAAPTP